MSTRNLRLLTTSIAVTGAVVLIGSCSNPAEPVVTAGLDSCAECNMVIDAVNQACGHVADGEFIPFDSPGCLLRSRDEMRHRGDVLPTEVFFADYESGAFVPMESAVFLLTEHIPTVMNAGVLSFSALEGAQARQTTADEEITDWMGYRRLRGRPDAIVEVSVSPGLLSPEIIEVAKGDLVLLEISGAELSELVTLTVRGYPEIGEIVVGSATEPIEVRFFATRPGAGFPVMGAGDEPIGMIRVTGAHTADEAAL